jgi:Rps23 Pro-64 3,4-dihydroxylase Tpa1-like proline 4-hydroxylase
VLKRIFRPKREEDGSWKKFHNDELHSLYSSQNIVRVIKSRRMRWVGHVVRMVGGERCSQDLGWEARRKETTGKTKA